MQRGLIILLTIILLFQYNNSNNNRNVWGGRIFDKIILSINGGDKW